jgi:hypothetical protein
LRAYRTTDNVLVEGKNGAVIRKHMGYGPIGSEHAERVQNFYWNMESAARRSVST